jgi:OmpA-OmpF porin, OOP family
MRNLGVIFLVYFWAGCKLQAQVSTVQKPVTLFSVRAVDDKSDIEIPASFQVKLHLANERYAGANKVAGENLTISMSRSDTVTVTTAAEGYHAIEEILLVSCDTCGYYQYTARLEKKIDSVFTDLKVNAIIALDKIYFDQSKYELRSESYEQLEKLYRTLRDTPKLKIEISGHTDNIGDPRLNQYLSENRARVIYAFLANKGISPERLKHRGYGHSRPLGPNDTEEHRELNRRVEFTVIAK